jgi:hypothetical protein
MDENFHSRRSLGKILGNVRLRLDGIHDVGFLRSVSPFEMVADYDFYDFLQNALARRRRLSVMACKRIIRLTCCGVSAGILPGTLFDSHRAMEVCISEFCYAVED